MSTRLNVSFTASYTFLWPLRRQVFKLAGTMISEYCVPSEFMLTVHLFYLPFSSVGGVRMAFHNARHKNLPYPQVGILTSSVNF